MHWRSDELRLLAKLGDVFIYDYAALWFVLNVLKVLMQLLFLAGDALQFVPVSELHWE